jgi:hypothetical protein
LTVKRAIRVQKAIKGIREIEEKRVNRDLPEKREKRETKGSPEKPVLEASKVWWVHRVPKANPVP